MTTARLDSIVRLSLRAIQCVTSMATIDAFRPNCRFVLVCAASIRLSDMGGRSSMRKSFFKAFRFRRNAVRTARIRLARAVAPRWCYLRPAKRRWKGNSLRKSRS